MIWVAWDIETCPLPLDGMTEAQRRRYEKELRRQLERTPAMAEEEASRLVRSVHPMLGWICCISAVSGTDTPNTPRSWSAASPGDECDMIHQFWNDIAPFRSPVWVTFNGKRFDVPWLIARSAHYHLTPTRHDLLNTHPYQHRPHLDLFHVLPQSFSLDDLCDHLAVPSPKSGLTATDVASAVADNRLDDVTSYCSSDVLATWSCAQCLRSLLFV